MTGIVMSLMNNIQTGLPTPVLYIDALGYAGSGTSWASDIGPSATLVNAPAYASAAPTYFDFNGTDQYAEFLHDSVLKPTTAITLEQWITADDWTAGDAVNFLASLSCTQGGGYAHYIWEGTWRSYVRVGASYQIPTADVSGFAPRSWHHVVTTFDGRYTRLYFDSVLVNTQDLGTSGNVIGYDPDNSLLIGAEATGTTGAAGQYWSGKVGLTRIWNRALNASQVVEIYAEHQARFANIITGNLQLYLDAADPGSYVGSGTTWIDLSSNAYNTTLEGAPTFNTTHFTFDGTTEYVDTNQSLAAESFSIGAWFRTSAAGVKMVLSKETTAGNPWNYRIWLNGGQINFDMSQVTTQSSLSSPLTTYNNGNWYLVMCTRDDSTWYMYVNGVQVNTKADTYTGSVTNAQELWIGRSAFTQGGASPTGSYQYTGDIGEIFIYDDVLTASEVLQNYNATKATYGL